MGVSAPESNILYRGGYLAVGFQLPGFINCHRDGRYQRKHRFIFQNKVNFREETKSASLNVPSVQSFWIHDLKGFQLVRERWWWSRRRRAAVLQVTPTSQLRRDQEELVVNCPKNSSPSWLQCRNYLIQHESSGKKQNKTCIFA